MSVKMFNAGVQYGRTHNSKDYFMLTIWRILVDIIKNKNEKLVYYMHPKGRVEITLKWVPVGTEARDNIQRQGEEVFTSPS